MGIVVVWILKKVKLILQFKFEFRQFFLDNIFSSVLITRKKGSRVNVVMQIRINVNG